MKTRPILFSAPMVRAILDWRKTQTRRIVKPEHLRTSQAVDLVLGSLAAARLIEATTYCPYGQLGDRLWVRETFSPTMDGGALYRADPMYDGMKPGDFAWSWKPSIFMPRWASRITLEITAVRVERLRDISDDDAVSEGYYFAPNRCPDEFDPAGWYESLWESINGPGSWAANPWVWVIEFQRIAQNCETQAPTSQAMTK